MDQSISCRVAESYLCLDYINILAVDSNEYYRIFLFFLVNIFIVHVSCKSTDGGCTIGIFEISYSEFIYFLFGLDDL